MKDCLKWQGGAECCIGFLARRSLFAKDGDFEFWRDLEKHGLCEMVKGMPELVDDNGIDFSVLDVLLRNSICRRYIYIYIDHIYT